VWKTPKMTLNNQTAITSDGTNVYLMPYFDRYFTKYIVAENRWVELAPPPISSYNGSDLVVLGDYIYAIFGSYQKEFARYRVSTNSWSRLSDAPDLIADGGTLETDGTYIYCMKGTGAMDFWRYNPTRGIWETLSGPPGGIQQGSSMMYKDGYIYAIRGNSTNFYRYETVTGLWTTLPVLPWSVGMNQNASLLGDNIFVTQGNGGTGFASYNIGSSAWTVLSGTSIGTRGVGVVANSTDNSVLVFRGNGTYDFWKYDIGSSQFLGQADLPNTPSTGSDLIYMNGLMYFIRGSNSASLYKYQIGGTSTALTSLPVNVNDDVKGVGASGYIFSFQGGGQQTFYRYNPAVGIGGTWEQMTNPPTPVYDGASLVYPGSGDYIYATRGGFSRVFWRYNMNSGVGGTWEDAAATDLPDNSESYYGSRLLTDGTDLYFISGRATAKLMKYSIGTTTWSEASNLPFAPYAGTDVTYYNGKIYVIAGNYKPDFWEFTINGSSWRRLPYMPTYGSTEIGPWAGASIETDGSGTFFVTYSNGIPRLISYTIDANLYADKGYWTSNAIDLTHVASFNSLTVGATLPSGTSYNWHTRTSADLSSWSSWVEGVGGSVGSSAGRYLQVGVTLSSGVGRSETPVITSLVVDYVGDTGVPSNPSSFSGLSSQVAGVGLSSGGAYNYISPYFSWSGATDPETSVAGYWVYFGSGSEADPGVSGSYQTVDYYQVDEPMDVGTYYLRLKTVDGVGNTSAATTGFVYQYNGLAPPISLSQESSVDFGLGTTANVNISNDEIRLKSKEGFWQQQRLNYMATSVYYGSGFAYVANQNRLYQVRGYNSNVFNIYDLVANVGTTGPTVPAAAYYGADIVAGPEGFLYATRGNSSNGFWRYNIGTSEWSDIAVADAPQTLSYGAAMVYDGDNYIYLMRGSGDDAFYRYDIQNNIWESLANIDFGAPITQVNNSVNNGGDLIYDGADTIYAIQGGSRTGFVAYSISGNSWTALANLPVIADYGAQIEYDGDNQVIYFEPGGGKVEFYKYNIGSQTWSELENIPRTVSAGAALIKIGEELYFARGGTSQDLFKYNIKKDSWLAPTVGLFDGWFRGSDSRTFYYGADIVKGDGDNFYLTKGNFDNLFIKYNPKTGATTKLADAPFGFYIGSELVYDSVRSRIYTAGNIYYRKMYYYDIATDTWTEETQDPPPFDSAEGSNMVFNAQNGLIYWVRGGSNNTFRTFNPVGVGTSKWASIAGGTTPATMQYGSDMVIKGDYIYALRGNNQLGAYKFGPLSVGGTWSNAAMADLPTGYTIYNDGFLTEAGEDSLMACRGQNTNHCLLYSISGDSWVPLGTGQTFAPYIYRGGAAAFDGENKELVIAANGQQDTFSNGLYTYVTQSNNSSFEEEGSYTSPVHDLTAVYRFASLEVGYSGASNASLTVDTRSSGNGETWDDWVAASDRRTTGTQLRYKVNSTPRRYLQVRLNLESMDGVYSGTVEGYTINYYQDTRAPDNPGFLNGYSNSGLATTLVSGVWSNSTAPYFSWPGVGESGGADDGSNGSGVEGYYVYFGIGETADPQALGTYTTGTSVIGTGLTSGYTYYLRIKTKDAADNVASDVGTTWVYRFDGRPPGNPTTIVIDPPSYTATNSFNINWAGGTDVDTEIDHYCYKTGQVGSTETCTSNTSLLEFQAYTTGTNTFLVRAVDSAGNSPEEYATASYYYSSIAPSVVRNLTATPSSNTINEYAFTWIKPQTYYGQETGLRYYYSINELPTASNVNAIGLSVTYLPKGAYATHKGTNTLYVVAKDEAGNIDYNLYSSVNFEAATSAPGIPRDIEIADVSVKETKSWKLAVSWDAPTATGSGIALYKVYRSATASADCTSDMSNFGYVSSTTGLSFVDVGLTQQKYYYCVKACDSTNECSAVSDTVSFLPDGRWRVAPSLVASPSAVVKTKSAIVSWSTNRTCNSFVKYGKASGDYGEEVGSSEQIASHSISLTGLDPGTTYYYKTYWTDEDGNTGSSGELTLATNPAPMVSAVKVTDLGLYSAYVTFTLKNASQAKVEYGKTVNYGSFVSVVTATNESSYTVKLEGLDEGTDYHMRISAEDEEANTFTSDDYTFETLPLPKVANVKIQQVKGMPTATIRVAWTSNTGISSIVNFYPVGRPEMARDQIVLTLSKAHEMMVKDLADDTDYIITIKGKDVAGNSCLPNEVKFKTSTDLRPPSITDFKTEASVEGVGEEARAKVTVYWDTDEPATAQVEYGEGTGSDYPNRTQEDETLQQNHTVTIPDLRPNQVYHLRVVTRDKAGNISTSYDNVLITPKSTKAALDLVVESLSKSFGFFNNLNSIVK
jgi:hypothetical protein